MKAKLNSMTKSQIIVLFAVGVIALLAIAVLVLDGGMVFLNRRAAQSAADAGALAGAKVLCSSGTAADALYAAEQYAEAQNGATNAVASFNAAGDIQVDVTMHQNSFFAGIFGIHTLDIPATAAANCFPPQAAKNVIPVAWACRAPVAGLPTESNDCSIQSLDWETEMKPLIDLNYSGGVPASPIVLDAGTAWESMITDKFSFKGKDGNTTRHTYIIMDSDKLVVDMSKDCLPNMTGAKINCDPDGDGVMNISANGDRSWLLLEQGKGAADLVGWIKTGLVTPLRIHTWLAGTSGDKNTVFKAVQNYIMATATNPYKFATLPVFDEYCDSNPYGNALCTLMIHNNWDDPNDQTALTFTDKIIVNDPNNYFHVIGFAAFYVTCVDDSGQVECPASKLAGLPGSDRSVEGYFVRNAPVTIGSGTGGADLGVYTRSLTR